MKNTRTIAVAAAMLMTTLACRAEVPADIVLPAPRMEGGKPLMQALKERQTSRAFSPQPLPPQVLSDLLWAAFGVNRPDSGKRTAPSARNWQEVDIYAVMEQGTYIYDAGANSLKLAVKGDLRALTGAQDFVAVAPLNLVFVADFEKMEGATPEGRIFNSAADVGFISQNVYLFCASEGLATVVRGRVPRDTLAEVLKLSAEQRIVLAQTVGYPGADSE